MKKTLLLFMLVAVLSMVLAGTAFAATPQEIYDDYMDNGVLDGDYSDFDLRAYLNDLNIHQYFNPVDVRELDVIVRGELDESRSTFPFTGTQIGLMAVGVIVLLGAGVGLRRMARAKK